MAAIPPVTTDQIVDENACGGGETGPGRQDRQILQVGLESALGFLCALGPVWSVGSTGQLPCDVTQDVGVAADSAGFLRFLSGRSQCLAQLVKQGPLRRFW